MHLNCMLLLAKMLADMLSVLNRVFICRRSGLFCTGFLLNLYFVWTFKVYILFWHSRY